MHYTVSIQDSRGKETRIGTQMKSFEVCRDVANVLHVCLGWDSGELRDDPYDYVAITRLWPGSGFVRVAARENNYVLFEGVVRAFGWRDGDIFLKAEEVGS